MRASRRAFRYDVQLFTLTIQKLQIATEKNQTELKKGDIDIRSSDHFKQPAHADGASANLCKILTYLAYAYMYLFLFLLKNPQATPSGT